MSSGYTKFLVLILLSLTLSDFIRNEGTFDYTYDHTVIFIFILVIFRIIIWLKNRFFLCSWLHSH